MTFVMLNPSTADAAQDDPTIRRCVSFATREGATHLNVVNLYALRATDPRALLTAADPIGPENEQWLKKEIRGAWKVVAAWGLLKTTEQRMWAAEVYNFGHPYWHRLGATKNGSPRHPLYLPKLSPLEAFKWEK